MLDAIEINREMRKAVNCSSFGCDYVRNAMLSIQAIQNQSKQENFSTAEMQGQLFCIQTTLCEALGHISETKAITIKVKGIATNELNQ